MAIERVGTGQTLEHLVRGGDFSLIRVLTLVPPMPVEVPAQTSEPIAQGCLTSPIHRHLASSPSED
jgi:hypothetical protein